MPLVLALAVWQVKYASRQGPRASVALRVTVAALSSAIRTLSPNPANKLESA